MKKKQEIKLSNVEKAILKLAEYMEDPMHDQFKIRQHIIEILEYEEVK